MQLENQEKKTLMPHHDITISKVSDDIKSHNTMVISIHCQAYNQVELQYLH